MSTTVSEPAAPTNNVIVRSRVPGEPHTGIGRGNKPALRPANTRAPYTKWHPGCLSGKCASEQNTDINQPFTTKVPKRTWRPVVARMARGARETKKKEGKGGESATRLYSAGVALKTKLPWLTMDVLIGSSVGVLVIALLITIGMKLAA